MDLTPPLRPDRGALTRRRLTDAAVQAFAERGYADTRVSDIVARAGVSQPIFYDHFTGKEALFGALVERFRTRVRQLIADSACREQSPPLSLRESLRLTCAAVFRAFAEDPALTRLALQQAPDAGQVKQDLVTLLAGNVRAAQESGRVRSDLPAELIAETIVGSVERLTWRYLVTGEIGADALARAVSDLHHDGFAPRSGPL
ncbi:hypothetical protein DEIPH_ctg005orf0053 [Deinococcus phoenicis]|uniref:HTH tetR-type domain-containing protein n=1 Tax=Deinococcus phoenicis TaxID=1476583 RepID=A0A016QTQ3_9DEIO|nr:TetR/AcrR family transcriptional regulator [Deinococcus phoenicis]EYB69490.1 hypothetical protein DEIPH_ctg005orf0053 [Deinococcus phoenicis]